MPLFLIQIKSVFRQEFLTCLCEDRQVITGTDAFAGSKNKQLIVYLALHLIQFKNFFHHGTGRK